MPAPMLPSQGRRGERRATGAQLAAIGWGLALGAALSAGGCGVDDRAVGVESILPGADGADGGSGISGSDGAGEDASRAAAGAESSPGDGVTKLALGCDCGVEQTCQEGDCYDWECPPNQGFCSGRDVRRCADNGLSSTREATCGDNQYCDPARAQCATGVCAPGQPACEQNTARTCNTEGSGYEAGGTPCGEAATCDAGDCKPHLCTPSASFCQGQQLQRCADNGLSSTLEQTCTNQACVESGGGASCAGECTPGRTDCANGGIRTCSALGAWGAPAACAASTTCVNDACVPLGGICVPGSRRCAAGQQPQLCNELGSVWLNEGGACGGGTPVCWNGGCVQCAPQSTDCTGSIPQVCSGQGTWIAQPACSEPRPVCVPESGTCAFPDPLQTAGSVACGSDAKSVCELSGGEFCCVRRPNASTTTATDYESVYACLSEMSCPKGGFGGGLSHRCDSAGDCPGAQKCCVESQLTGASGVHTRCAMTCVGLLPAAFGHEICHLGTTCPSGEACTGAYLDPLSSFFSTAGMGSCRVDP